MEENALKETAREFYLKLYTRDASVSCNPMEWNFPKLCFTMIE